MSSWGHQTRCRRRRACSQDLSWLRIPVKSAPDWGAAPAPASSAGRTSRAASPARGVTHADRSPPHRLSILRRSSSTPLFTRALALEVETDVRRAISAMLRPPTKRRCTASRSRSSRASNSSATRPRISASSTASSVASRAAGRSRPTRSARARSARARSAAARLRSAHDPYRSSPRSQGRPPPPRPPSPATHASCARSSAR